MERDEVALGQQLVERSRYVAPSGPVTSSGSALDVVVQDPHPEPLGPPRDRLADPPEADDAERRAVDVRPEQQQRPPRLPAAGADVAIALGHAPGGGHQQRQGEVGGRLGQDARRVADGDAAPRARGDVDVVEADRVVADDPELRPGRVEELVVDPVGQQVSDAVAAGDPAQELVARRRQLVLPDVQRRRPPRSAVEPLVGDPARDEDARTVVGPLTPAPRRAARRSVRIRPSASVRFSREFA